METYDCAVPVDAGPSEEPTMGLASRDVGGDPAEAVARNPGARAGIQTLLVLGLAFIESLAIFTLLIIFVK